jgi:hypothetical protein
MEYKYAFITAPNMQTPRGDWVVYACDPSFPDMKYFQISQFYTEKNLRKIPELAHLHTYEMEPLFGSCKPGDIIQYAQGEPMVDFAFNTVLVRNRTLESEINIRLGHKTTNRAIITAHKNKDSMYDFSRIYAYNPNDGYITINQDPVDSESWGLSYDKIVALIKSCSNGDIIKYMQYNSKLNNVAKFALTNNETLERMSKKPGRLSIRQILHFLSRPGKTI